MVGEAKPWLGGVFWITILTLAGVLIITNQVDPFSATQLEKVIFFLALGLASWGLATILIFYIRHFFIGGTARERIFQSSFWWGLLLAVVFLGYLIFF